ncbi:hypothetical protein SUGI_0117930 [Cryptomeria japonica]|nr:hypothetical protein SUGI_0117930 [Cryptomeria japonica]
MSHNMCEETVEEEEVKRCSTSVEGMLEFILFLFGYDVDLLSNMSVVGSGQQVIVTKASKRENIVGGQLLVVCHNFVFPYGVTYCHSINGSEVFDFQLKVMHDNGKVKRNATAVCHYLSDGAGGNQTACHPIYGEIARYYFGRLSLSVASYYYLIWILLITI